MHPTRIRRSALPMALLLGLVSLAVVADTFVVPGILPPFRRPSTLTRMADGPVDSAPKVHTVDPGSNFADSSAAVTSEGRCTLGTDEVAASPRPVVRARQSPARPVDGPRPLPSRDWPPDWRGWDGAPGRW